jgi:hypothetical protein
VVPSKLTTARPMRLLHRSLHSRISRANMETSLR